MQLNELDSFNLNDAVRFHDKLNPALFDGDKLKQTVRDQLLVIAEDFVDHLGINNLDIEDITISGSNAAYSYTDFSDIDLHILVDMNKFNDDDVYRELFDAKKTVYNDTHDIAINGYEVELYVQDTNQPVISLGEYSILHNSWIKLPRKRRAHIDQIATKLKYQKLYKLGNYAYKSDNINKIKNVLKTIKKYRQAGLDMNGEFGPENLAFKIMRKKGYIKKLYDKLQELHDKKLSLPESVNPKIFNDIINSLPIFGTKPVRIGDYMFDARTFIGGLGDSNAKGLQIRAYDPKKPKYQRMIGSADFTVKNDKKGNSWLESDDTEVNDEYQGKGVATMMYAYAKSLGNDIKPSPYQSNAGKQMWSKWGSDAEHLMKEASGYIPSTKEKNDPRFKTALTVDVTPYSIQDNARKLGSKINRDGTPPLLRA